MLLVFSCVHLLQTCIVLDCRDIAEDVSLISKNFPSGGSAVKNLPAIQETQVLSLGWEDLLEEGMATPSSILAWL